MIRYFVLVLTLATCMTRLATAGDSLMKEYIQAYSGRWVCDTVTDNDIEGYWKKGDKLRLEVVNTPCADWTSVRWEWQASKDGVKIGSARGLVAWDPSSQCIKTFGSAAPTFLVQDTITKVGDKWQNMTAVTFPDGSKSSGTVVTTISDGGDTHTELAKDRMDKDGNPEPDSTDVWRRVSKNHEVLDQQLGWIIGTWTGKYENPHLGTQEIELVYKWIADDQVIQLNIRIGDVRGVSIILYDPSDDLVKMWGTNSTGGNGQAVLSKRGDALVWTNSASNAVGERRVAEFSYEKSADGRSIVVKFVDRVDGVAKQVVVHKE